MNNRLAWDDDYGTVGCSSPGESRASAVGDQELGLAFTHKRVLVKMAPADVLKEVPEYDLPIAVGMLVMTTGRSWRCNQRQIRHLERGSR